MAKTGDKFIIEIADVFKAENGELLYRVKGFRSLVFDQMGINKLKEFDSDFIATVGYLKGSTDAWKAASKIENEIPIADLNKIFKSDLPGDIYNNFTPSRAMEIIQKYEKEKRAAAVEVGDIVRNKKTGKKGVVLNIANEQELRGKTTVNRYVVYIMEDGDNVYIISTPELYLDDYEKTGEKSSGPAILLNDITRNKDKEAK